jgi:hypothetical protein
MVKYRRREERKKEADGGEEGGRINKTRRHEAFEETGGWLTTEPWQEGVNLLPGW